MTILDDVDCFMGKNYLFLNGKSSSSILRLGIVRHNLELKVMEREGTKLGSVGRPISGGWNLGRGKRK